MIIHMRAMAKGAIKEKGFFVVDSPRFLIRVIISGRGEKDKTCS